MQIIHILIVDDDSRIRNLLATYLDKNGYIVTTAENANIAELKLKRFRFDLIILDVMMPGKSGFEFTKELKQNNFTTPILILSAMGEAENRIKGLSLGADDYLAKPFEPQELLLRMKNILNKIDDKPQNICFGSYIFDVSLNELRCAKSLINLTSSELIILKHLCNNLCVSVSREDISNILNGVSERSVDVQINRLRQKIEKDPKNPLNIKTIRNHGYCLYGFKL